MCNIYFSVEPQWKIKSIFLNLKNFYILDIQEIISNMELDTTKTTAIYYINNYIIDEIKTKSRIKRIHGILYINKNLNKDIFLNLKSKLEDDKDINKYILIDNGVTSKLKDIYSNFQEVLFFDRFQKIKISEGA